MKTTTAKQGKFSITSLGMGDYSAHVYAKLGRREMTVRFLTAEPSKQPSASNPFNYVNTCDKVSGDKLEDISEDQKKECQKVLVKEAKAKARSLRRWEKSIGRKA